MKAIQKIFHSDHPFSFEIVYKDSKSEQSELPLHFHEWYEIVYVYQGKGSFLIDQSIQTMEAGNIFIIPGHTIHRAIPDKNDPVMSTALFFNPTLVSQRLLGDSFHLLSLFDEATRLKRYKYFFAPEHRDKIETSLSTIYTEMTEGKIGYRHAALIQLQALVIFLYRNITNFKVFEPSTYFGPNWMNNVLNEIEKNYMNGISLESLAVRGNVSPAHLSRVFKKITGLNLSEYIITKKIVKAKELLLRSEKKVVEIANECGFESMPYFHRTFKKFTGHTPAQYRKQHDSHQRYNRLLE